MSSDAARSAKPGSFEQLRYARQVLLLESRTLAQLAKRLDHEFCRAVEYLYGCRGSVIVSGMGKAGLAGQKIMATLASTGTRSHCLHPAEAVHGDLGRIHHQDVILLLSQSGETEEVVRLLASLAERRRDHDLDRPIRQVMTARPLTIRIGSRMADAVALMAERKISGLPVVDPECRPVGLIDVTDAVGILPDPTAGRPADGVKLDCRVFNEPRGRQSA